jgi:antitoxin ParD1/3/4
MTVVNITLPDEVKEYVDQRIADGQFGSTSDYFRDLVLEDQKRQSQEHLELLLIEGLDSGEPIEVDEAYISRKRAGMIQRISML